MLRSSCRRLIQALGLFSLIITVRAADGGADTLVWYDKPAAGFNAALPMGNGRLGAMVCGGVDNERLILNESSVWSGSPEETDRPNAHRALPEIRKLLLEGNLTKAEALVNKSFTCLGRGTAVAAAANAPFGCYQILGNLRMHFEAPLGEVSQYRRELDLATGASRVSYRKGDALWTREYLVSAPDEVVACRFTTTKRGGLSLDMTLDRPERATTTAPAENELLMTGTLNDGRGGKGVTHATRLRCVTRGGTVKADGKRLVVTGADEVVVLLTAATDYRGFAGGRQLADALAAARTDLDRAASRPFADLAERQHADHAKYFNRVKLNLPATATSALPTDRRVEAFDRGADDPALAALFFNFGRHLLIASSRPGGLPGNLQGIWADQIQTPWNSDWHFNINLQMNYWPAEICDLPELHEPLLRLVAAMTVPGEKTAKAYYNSRGWIAHVVTNPWGFTSPGEAADWGSSVSGSAWLCHHIWHHYEFTGDREFLKKYYPVLRGCVLFYLDNIFEEPTHKWLVTGPSGSPENRFLRPDGSVGHISLAPTIDMQLLRELFANTAEAARLLGVDADLRAELTQKRARLVPNRIGPDGRILEWLEPYAEPDPHHNHTSPLYGLYPYNEITPRGTPEMAEAARKLLIARGENNACWPYAWRSNMWARLGDHERAMKSFKRVLRPARGNASGVSTNLFSQSPYQIDANFGACAAVVEMLVQSHAGEIELLPALPKEWPTGSLRGVKARGGFRVNLEWSAGVLRRASIESTGGTATTVRYRDKVIPVKLAPGELVNLSL